jgi:hypothetical protein
VHVQFAMRHARLLECAIELTVRVCSSHPAKIRLSTYGKGRNEVSLGVLREWK